MHSLTSRQYEDYERQGYVLIPGAFPADELRRIDDEIERLLPVAEERGAYPGWLLGLHRQNHSDSIRRLCEDPRIIDLIADLVHPGVAIHSSKLVAKVPNSAEICHWHQDEAYYYTNDQPDTRSESRMSAWIPLQDVDETNGCLWVVPGSHRSGIEQYQEVGVGHCRRRIIRSDYANEHAEPVAASVGDLVLFNAFLWHQSRANHTDRVRRAFIISYQEVTVAQDSYGETPTVLRAAS